MSLCRHIQFLACTVMFLCLCLFYRWTIANTEQLLYNKISQNYFYFISYIYLFIYQTQPHFTIIQRQYGVRSLARAPINGHCWEPNPRPFVRVPEALTNFPCPTVSYPYSSLDWGEITLIPNVN